MDKKSEKMINFKDFCEVLGVMCKSDVTQRIKLLYFLHLPPALLSTDPDPTGHSSASSKSESKFTFLKVLN